MSQGPIEFIGEEPPRRSGRGEYGGESGLIQPLKPDLLSGDPEASGGHSLTEDAVGGGVDAEVSAGIGRAGVRPLPVSVQRSGNWVDAEVGVDRVEDPEAVIDPATGRQMPDTRNVEGGQGADELSSLKP